MKKTSLAKCLKVILAVCAVCGLPIYFHYIPVVGKELAQGFPEFAYCFWPWMIFIWLTGIPCYGVLALAWRIAGTIQKDEAFTFQNGSRFRWIGRLMVGDAVFLVCGAVLYLVLGMAHPSMVILSVGLGCAGGALAIAAQAMAQLTDKAAALQEQSDWTI